MADITILDAPETPAPIFAYRALKGMIFGSPTHDEEENNKENIDRSTHSIRAKISSLQSVTISPSKRRKIYQHQSPAKSILRTPGIPTPRKQNANVTFKDVTPSLSPEVTRKAALSVNAPTHQNISSKEFISVAEDAQTKSHAIQKKLTAKFKIKGEDGDISKQGLSDRATQRFDFEEYKLSTEKEMKKLVRYGQKMREYARKQDEENTKLRLALEELRKENEALRLHEDIRTRPRLNGEPVGWGLERGGDEQTKSSTKQNQPPKHGGKAALKEVKKRQPTETSAATQELVVGMSKARSQTEQARLSPLKRKASSQLIPEPVMPPPTSRSPARSLAPRPAHVRLPADRLAAARERIRLKTELRRAEINPSSPVDWNAL